MNGVECDLKLNPKGPKCNQLCLGFVSLFCNPGLDSKMQNFEGACCQRAAEQASTGGPRPNNFKLNFFDIPCSRTLIGSFVWLSEASAHHQRALQLHLTLMTCVMDRWPCTCRIHPCWSQTG